MASSEKQMIALEDTPPTDEGISEMQQSSTTDLVGARFPSRPRRKVVIIAVVIAVIIVVAVAASLIGKYVSADSKSEKDSKDKGTGEPEGNRSLSTSPSAISSLDVLSVESSQLPSANVTSTDLQYGRTSSLPKLTSLTTTKSSDSDASAIPSSVADMSSASSAAVLTVITSLVPNRAATSSLRTATKPSTKVTSSDFQQSQTSPLPRMTSSTSATVTSSMSEAPSINSTMSA